VFKLGVIAPFEGRARDLGYAILPAVKDAVAEANRSGILGVYRVTVVAFNDSMDPVTAAQQAKALALDPDVIGVVGPFSPETAAVALPILAQGHITSQPIPNADPLDEDYSQEQAQAKEAARNLLWSLAAEIESTGRPTRPAFPVR
jgi:hypothetical protein